MKTLKELVRPSILRMAPYSSARDEFQGEASVFLDANENPFDTTVNRYPDPMQWALKRKIAALKEVDIHQILLGNGSDEPIDLLIRAFCEPKEDKIVSMAPSYGMYEVAANVNNVPFVQIPLDKDFDIDIPEVEKAIDAHTKLIFLCSPNNPSGNRLSRDRICHLLNTFDGIVVVDEAYIDFSSEPSFLKALSSYPNLVVLQTLSKAWGAAGIRLGMAFADPEIIAVLNTIKYPYNVNQLTQQFAAQMLDRREEILSELQIILQERDRMRQALLLLPCVKKIYPTDANFILTEVTDANKIYTELVKQGIIVRNRTNVMKCRNCLRLTIGTPEENSALLHALQILNKEV